MYEGCKITITFHNKIVIAVQNINDNRNGMLPFTIPTIVIVFFRIPIKTIANKNSVAIRINGIIHEKGNVSNPIIGKLTKTKSVSLFNFDKSIEEK